MKGINHFFVTTVLLFVFLPAHTQDPSFSQFFANRLYLNPAWAGIGDNERRLFLNYRNQWPGIDNAFVTYSVSYDQFMKPMHGGFGIRVMNDVQGNGAVNQLSLAAIYSYHLYVTREFTITAGFEAGYVQRQMNAATFNFADESESYGNIKNDFPDFTVGFSGFYRNIYGGISMAHLTRPVQSAGNNPDSRLPRKLTVYAGGFIPVYERHLGKEVLQLSPNLIYVQQQSYTQINYGMEGLVKNQFLAGVWLRQDLGLDFSALIFSAGYVTKSFRIRYSYDHQISNPTIKLPSMGTHEISLIITPDGRKKIKHRAIKCPKI
ncbi:MAG TPA: PorP/SprF family type IX secretion system membrane protein [Bacteroidales bacterium]|nr:PorP/SprF family type IX secretion system membrane protein [Bacteroidales bacterium]